MSQLKKLSAFTRIGWWIGLLFSWVPQPLKICHYFFKHILALSSPPGSLSLGVAGLGRTNQLCLPHGRGLRDGWKTRAGSPRRRSPALPAMELLCDLE